MNSNTNTNNYYPVNQEISKNEIQNESDSINCNLLKRTITNTSNMLKRTLTVSSNTVSKFTNAFEYDYNIAITDLSAYVNKIYRQPTREELNNINKELDYII